MTSKIRPEPTIPDHEVYRKIGGGAYGEVWLAKGVTGALRAVKVVWREDFEDERGFEREFEGIEKYEPVSRDHPSLVTILHVGRGESEGEAFYYYVMELGDDVSTAGDINPVEYEARTLRGDMVRMEHKPLEVGFCVKVGKALAEGLDHLHQNGLAHRDVKPSNVIFVEGNPKLADIGLVALRDQRTFVGTEGFVPPEGPGSAQADIYSLGKVLYEMATGKDRLDFPELPDELPKGKDLKRWRALNGVICDVCEPRLSKRRIKSAAELAEEMKVLETGSRRPLRINRGVSLALLGLAALIGLIWQFLLMRPWQATSDGGNALPPVPEVLVTIRSNPPGATVYDEEGKVVGDTPFVPRSYPLGMVFKYTFRLEGYRTQSIVETVKFTKDEEGQEVPFQVISPVLSVYDPPVEGDPWKDFLGMTYKAVGREHRSNYLVGESEWKSYLEDVNRKGGVIEEVSESGQVRTVVFCAEEEAARFAKWLEGKSRDGYLTADHEMQALPDRGRDYQEVSDQVLKEGLRPFYMLVRRIPYAHLAVTSEPSGAAVYINDQLRGETPLLGHSEGGVKVKSGAVRLVIEAEGYEREEPEVLQLADDEVRSVHYVLRESKGVIFGKTWSNSLGMKFAPITGDEDLMVSIWETRVKDYQVYVQNDQEAILPREPDFPQGENHPVVFVNIENAEEFCSWLTKFERKKGLIATNHQYRLPSDSEWSLMVGLDNEPGNWPVERSNQPFRGFPWGRSWPPEEGSGNYADETSATQGIAPIDKSILGYKDGFAFTAPVGRMEPNEFGLYDLGGNVHEWVSDHYDPTLKYTVTRGGGWNSYQVENLYSAFRNSVPGAKGAKEDIYGFRVVLAKEELIPEPDDEAAVSDETFFE